MVFDFALGQLFAMHPRASELERVLCQCRPRRYEPWLRLLALAPVKVVGATHILLHRTSARATLRLLQIIKGASLDARAAGLDTGQRCAVLATELHARDGHLGAPGGEMPDLQTGDWSESCSPEHCHETTQTPNRDHSAMRTANWSHLCCRPMRQLLFKPIC